MKLLKTLVVSLALAVPLVASAQSTPRFDQRQGNQAQAYRAGHAVGRADREGDGAPRTRPDASAGQGRYTRLMAS